MIFNLKIWKMENRKIPKWFNDFRFERAFAAATLGDNFNICCLFIIFPIELVTGVLEICGKWIVDLLVSEQGLKFKTLELLTDPVNNFILQVSRKFDL